MNQSISFLNHWWKNSETGSITEMTTSRYISIPAIPNFANLVYFPFPQNVRFLKLKSYLNCIYLQGQSSVYLFSTKVLKPYQSNQRVQVELLPDFVYCLLPSVFPNSGSLGKYEYKSGFIKDLHLAMDFWKVSLW